ncbi:protein-export membrane protein, SecD/SecF family [Mycobacteroides abscessus subsp. abscessus]|nr:protein-export membrane protein, SecD/SecF family [Mycobacteroides abscessus subsp. abscessus]
MSEDPNLWRPPPGMPPPAIPQGPLPPWPPQMPPWQPPVSAAKPEVPRWLVGSVLAVLILGYGAVVLVTKDIWRAGSPGHTVHVSLAVKPPPGTTATPDALDRTRKALADRLRHIGGHKVTVGLDGNVLKVSATNVTEAQLRSVTVIGQLRIRPVIHAIASQFKGTPSTQAPTRAPDAQRIADEKALRQSAQPQIQLLALQFQATRCGQPDALADHDDPTLPLVTCSDDGKQVYLLDKSIISGDQIKDASARQGGQRGDYVVFVSFDDKAADVWSTFTAANTGSRTAFTVDTRVVSAPALLEPITTGRTQIHGQFTADSAKSFAAVLAGGALPLPVSVQSVQADQVAPAFWSVPRIAVVGGGVVVIFAVILGVVLMTRWGPRHR